VKLAMARVTALQLPLRKPLATAHGAVSVRSGALLELEAEGSRGFGEALPLPGFGLETAGTAEAALASACRRLVGCEIADASEALRAAATELTDAPAARAALDTAWRDLSARATGSTVAAALAAQRGEIPRDLVETGFLLGGEDPAAIESQAAFALAKGFRTLKLKLGSGSFEHDLARARAARRAAPRAALRLDANAGWSEGEAARHINALATLEPELLEQPVAFDAIDAMARLRAQAPFPLAADEAVRDLASACRLLSAGAADILVLKPAAIGGPGAALAIAEAAAAAGVELLVTSFLDGAIGRSAALHVAASLPRGGHAAGLATGALLADDVAALVEPHAGAFALPTRPGLGITPAADAVRRLATATAQEFRA
jgi:o-succinylbenzoate synthase